MNKYEEKIKSLIEKEFELSFGIAQHLIDEYELLEDYEEDIKERMTSTIATVVSILATELQDIKELKEDMDKIAKIVDIVYFLENEDNSIL